MDLKDIDVMVADPSHEEYVDTILETIREAAGVDIIQADIENLICLIIVLFSF